MIHKVFSTCLKGGYREVGLGPAIATIGLSLALSGSLSASPFEGPWVETKSLVLSNGDTSSPILGTGEADSAGGAMYATFEPVTLQVGESITLKADLRIKGSNSMNVDEALRIGFFDRSGNSGTTGWKGYLAATRNKNGAYAIFKRSGTDAGEFNSVNSSGSYLPDSGNTSSGVLGSKSFYLEETVTRTGTGITVTASFTQTSTGAEKYYFSLTATTVDMSPLTTTFDAVGFATSGLGAEEILLSNVELVRPNTGLSANSH